MQVGITVNVKDEKTGTATSTRSSGSAEANPGEKQALQRVAGRQGADGAQARRHRRRRPAQRQEAQARRSPRSTSRRLDDGRGGQAPTCSRRGGPSSSACAPTASSRSARLPGVHARSARSTPRTPTCPAGQDSEPRYRVAGACTPAAGRARWPSWTSTTARGASSCRPASTCSARSRWRACSTSTRRHRRRRRPAPSARGAASSSLRVDGFAVLAKSLRPPPDKFHGLHDVETRFRHRELDLIANEEARDAVRRRARGSSSAIRALPRRRRASSRSRRRCCSRSTAARWRARSSPHHNALDRDLYLRIATELYLKRLHRRRPRARLRARARTSATRASTSSTTPSSRCSSGTRPTRTTTT